MPVEPLPAPGSSDDLHLHALHTAVNCYLATLDSVANALANACPEIGGLYRHRLSRLRARLAFDSSAPALEESADAVEEELVEYGLKASAYVEQHRLELRSAISVLEEIVRSLAHRQDFYGTRLRQFAAQMESAQYPSDPERLKEAVALQVAGLLSCVESMGHETQSLMARMDYELASVERRLEESEVTDPLTGLMNRREMERHIEARKGVGTPPVLLHFHLSGHLTDEVVRQVGARLGSQFRHKDFISRWTENEFLVLFQGPIAVARSRSEQIVPWLRGCYALDNGETTQIEVEVKLLEGELIASGVGRRD